MDYVFSRIQIGYDAITLAYLQPEGQYDVYLLGNNKEEERFMFRTEHTEENQILALVREWVRNHLPEEARLVLYAQCNDLDSYREYKKRLGEKLITYEVKGKTFYIRQGDLSHA